MSMHSNPRKGLAGIALDALVVAALALLAGCGGTPTRYYTLAEPTASAAGSRVTADTAALAIEMAPVALPERFARPQLVVRRGAGVLASEKKSQESSQAEVEVLEQSRWSSSFEYELRDALGAGVARRLSAFDATQAGRPRGLPVYRIVVQVSQFDAVPGERIDGAFGWSIRRSDSDTQLTCQVQFSESIGAGMDGVAIGAQRITSRLADEIARNVSALAASQNARCPAA